MLVLLRLEQQHLLSAITNTKLYVLVVTLSTQDNVKILQQLKSGKKKHYTGTNVVQNQK